VVLEEIDDVYTLKLMSVQYYHTGVYVCEGTKANGNAFHAESHLFVGGSFK